MAGKIRFYYTNYWKDYTVTATSEHPHFPASNTQNRWPSKSWRSNYGAGSGWGTFVIEAGVNDRLDFDEGGGALVALLAAGTYNVDSLGSHLKTQMEAVGANLYTWEYIESGADSNKFNITSSGVTLNLLWNTGANKARSIADSIGFDDSADRNGAVTYTADAIRIHTHEILSIDLDVNTLSYYGAFIKGHNLQDGAIVYLEGSDDNFATLNNVYTITIQDDILATIRTVADYRRYWRFRIIDVDNPAGYIEMGSIYLGSHFAPLRHFHPSHSQQPIDPSILKESTGGQVSSIQKPHTKIYSYLIPGTDEKDTFDEMFDAAGMSKEMFYIENKDGVGYRTTARFVKIHEYGPQHLAGDVWNVRISLKVLA